MEYSGETVSFEPGLIDKREDTAEMRPEKENNISSDIKEVYGGREILQRIRIEV